MRRLEGGDCFRCIAVSEIEPAEVRAKVELVGGINIASSYYEQAGSNYSGSVGLRFSLVALDTLLVVIKRQCVRERP